MKTETGFAPIVDDSPRILILGSMPGVKSLVENKYYAHPRNAFWPIMADIFQFNVTESYTKRCLNLTHSGVAVWDVLQACRRPGSLDANIDSASLVINDFQTFFQQYNTISHVFLNGAKADSLFLKQALPTLNEHHRNHLVLQRLPSTSPAYAAMSFEQKLLLWQEALTLNR